MREMVEWIAAEAERPEQTLGVEAGRLHDSRRDAGATVAASHVFLTTKDTKVHEGSQNADFLQSTREEGCAGVDDQSPEISDWERREQERERRIYRGRTVAMLRRYMRYSMETGRLPSLLGREFFRAKVTSYTVVTFEDRVIFVHDVEKCLERLDELSRQVLGRIVLQEYEHEEAAKLLGCTRMTVHRKLVEALDALSDVLLEVKLLEPVASGREKSCQGGKRDEFLVSSCEEDE
jgi:DNA-directed RNA polymerase specialized sigma24 family protein